VFICVKDVSTVSGTRESSFSARTHLSEQWQLWSGCSGGWFSADVGEARIRPIFGARLRDAAAIVAGADLGSGKDLSAHSRAIAVLGG
jgi:hypothetical protein